MLHQDLLNRLCHARDALRAEDNYERPIGDVARAAGVSRFHFIRLFKAVFGETPQQCRSLAQVEKARHLLVLGDWSVTDVCMAVGFSSLGSFSSLFTRRVGESPSAYQRRNRQAVEVPGELPKALTPGCYSLMGRIPAQNGNSQEARAAKSCYPLGPKQPRRRQPRRTA